jgi:galactonate dehydratase
MRITRVSPFFVGRYLFVEIETGDGLVGIGESGAWGHLEASAAAIAKFGEYLIGEDARQIELHWNVMNRAHHFTGAATGGAISAIDIALWDLKGKRLGVPVYELLGGPVRSKVRLYAHVKGATIEEQIARALTLQQAGFTAIGHLNPFLDEPMDEPYYRAHARKMTDAVDNVRAMREAVGPDMDLCIEIHRRLSPPEAVTFGRRIEPFLPMFIEDPIPPQSPDAMASVAAQLPIPVATGERFTNLQQFQTLLARGGARFLRPCICLCGGITAGRKIAALAEAHAVDVVPHNPLSPLSLVACLQIDAAVPNFAIQEFPAETGGVGLRDGDMVTGLAAPVDGFLELPRGPGLGVELVREAKTRPRTTRPIQMRRHVDGFVVEM